MGATIDLSQYGAQTAPGPIGSVTPSTGAFTTLTASSFLGVGATVASVGLVRLPNAAANGISARNAANSGDVDIVRLDGANQVLFGNPTAPAGIYMTVAAAGALIVNDSGNNWAQFAQAGGSLYSANVKRIDWNAIGVGFFAATPVAKQAITGALTTVADAAAKALLTSIITALANYGLATNSTT